MQDMEKLRGTLPEREETADSVAQTIVNEEVIITSPSPESHTIYHASAKKRRVFVRANQPGNWAYIASVAATNRSNVPTQ